MSRQSGAASSRWPEQASDAEQMQRGNHGQLLFVWGTDAARHLCKSVADIWSLINLLISMY